MTPINYIDLKNKKIAVKLSYINEISLFATVVIYGNPIQSAAGQPKSPRAKTATQIRVAVP